MITVGSYEAKTHLAALLDSVAKGEKVTITRHGVPVAVLQSVDSRDDAKIEAAIEKIKQIRKSKSLDGVTFRELIEGGRRY